MKVVRKVEPRVYYQAEAFHIAAETLNESKSMEFRGAPFIVNASFALELYLKCFDGQTIFDKPTEYFEGVTQYGKVFSKGNEQGHHLSSLFNSLSIEYQNKVIDKFDALDGELLASNFFEKYNTHFVTWRYGFEGNHSSYVAAEVLIMLSVLQSVGKEYL
ncbi:hypothetical protein [Psychromonas sp. SP041]|uniref:hypothetical protein n=1 Tax=Psychromonas sp. SP041 TaxID=1365007 RepID=UPI000406B2BE|nr:hypothetical protein [Psychromonas sp. SP041]